MGCYSADHLARKVADVGLECVQLALGKAIHGVDLKQGVIHPGMAAEVKSAFSRHRVGIEVLGCYINPIHPDATTRQALLDLFKEHLRHARDFGCNIVALESGSPNADQSYHSDNSTEDVYQDLLDSIEELVAEAERCGVVVGIEAVTSHVLSSPDRMRRLLDDIPSSHLQVIFDPVNLLSLANHHKQREMMRRSFELFGDRIAVVHAKDFQVMDGKLVTCPAGLGLLDYGQLLSWVTLYKPGIAVLLEEAGPENIVACVRFVLNQSLSPIS